MQFSISGGQPPYTINGFPGDIPADSTILIANLENTESPSEIIITITDTLNCSYNLMVSNQLCNCENTIIGLEVGPFVDEPCRYGISATVESFDFNLGLAYAIKESEDTTMLVSTDFQPNGDFDLDEGGTYIVYAANSCDTINKQITLDEPLSGYINFQYLGESYIANAISSGGTPPYYYQWNNGSEESNILVTDTIFPISVIINDSTPCYITVTNAGPPVGINSTATWVREVQIYPNPSHQSFNIDFGNLLTNQKTNISLHNTLGQELYTKTLIFPQNTQINLPNFAKGIYFLKVQIGEGVMVERVVLH